MENKNEIMERIITIIVNIILFENLIFSVNQNAIEIIFNTILFLMCLLIFYLIRYKKRYISKSIILVYISCIILQIIMLQILKEFNIWEVSNGDLNGAIFGMLFYFCLQILFLVLLLIINIFKYIVKLFMQKSK